MSQDARKDEGQDSATSRREELADAKTPTGGEPGPLGSTLLDEWERVGKEIVGGRWYDDIEFLSLAKKHWQSMIDRIRELERIGGNHDSE